jgi:hypothetical protein
MVLVACIAVGSALVRAVWLGNIYQLKYRTSKLTAESFRRQGEKVDAESKQSFAAAAGLRAGKITDSVPAKQQELLRSFERGAIVHEWRKLYADFAEGHEAMGRLQESQGREWRRQAEYYEGLAANYDRARWRPWLTVARDPGEVLLPFELPPPPQPTPP